MDLYINREKTERAVAQFWRSIAALSMSVVINEVPTEGAKQSRPQQMEFLIAISRVDSYFGRRLIVRPPDSGRHCSAAG